jgi:hypothetical protein
MTNKNNKNALAGQNIEYLIKNSVCNQPNVIEKLKTKYGIKGDLDNVSRAGVYGDKADVRIAFVCGHYIGVNVKGYKQRAGFNQLARTSVSKFCEDFGLTDKDKRELESFVVAKSKNVKDPLFPDAVRAKWGKIFKEKAKELLKWGFSENPSRDILAVYNSDDSRVKIYPMKEVLSNLSREIRFTKGGFNIGDCVSFQRKGGNGSMSKNIPKTSIKHPGNNIQMKLKIPKMIELLEDIKLAEYRI